MDKKSKDPRDFKVPAWMMEVPDDAPDVATKTKVVKKPGKPAVQAKKTVVKPTRSKPQGQRKYKDMVNSHLDRVDEASGFGKGK